MRSEADRALTQPCKAMSIGVNRRLTTAYKVGDTFGKHAGMLHPWWMLVEETKDAGRS